MESHKAIIPCERCENSSKLHQIKTHLMTPLVIRCRNTCVSDSTAPKRGSVFIRLMTPDGAIWSRYQRAVFMR